MVRVGDTVRRATGPWTTAVHALLRHLERAGFTAAPRVLGIDEQGREVLSYLPGVAACRSWPEALLDPDGVASLGNLLAAYHRAVTDFLPPPGAVWRVGTVALQPGQVIRHGDLGPWNTIWRDGKPVGLIDWDFAEPGAMLDDLAQVAWDAIPLRDDAHARECGFAQGVDRRRRLEALCDGYGGRFTPAEVVAALLDLQRREEQRILERGGRGEAPWSLFLARGGHLAIAADRHWLAAAAEGCLARA